MKALAISVGACGVGYYYGNPTRAVGFKALYATLATGIGINVGLVMGDSRIDSASAAAIYWLIVGASGYLNVSSADPSRLHEAVGIAALGRAPWATRRLGSN